MKAFLLILSMGWFVQGWAQQDYFVFMQSENRQPFYVRIGEKNYSSSSTGHVILSKLKDSAYVLTVGFPQGQFQEQEFTVRVSRRDRGFELKNLGEKGWALFDWQTMELINAAKPNGTGGGAGYSMVKKNDDFAKLMSSVVNDTAVMYTVIMPEKKEPVVVAKKDTVQTDVAKIETKPVQDDASKQVVETKKPEEQKADTVRAVNPIVIKDSSLAKVDPPVKKPDEIKEEPKKQDTLKTEPDVAKVDPSAKKPDVIKEEPKKDTVKTQPDVAKVVETKKPENETIIPKKTEQDPMKDSVLNPPALPVISVVKQFKTDTGYHMIVVDDLKDSIHIFIPADAPNMPEKKQEEKIVPDTAKKVAAPIVTQPKQDIVKEPKQDSVKADVPPIKNAVDTPQKSNKLFMVNSDCKAFATPNDVDKLRVKLINEKDSEARLAAAKKVFKTRCFSALQIKALSEMFPYDEQKYKFLEMAYPFASDTGNFKGLVSLLKDPVYVQRFRKLVRLD